MVSKKNDDSNGVGSGTILQIIKSTARIYWNNLLAVQEDQYGYILTW